MYDLLRDVLCALLRVPTAPPEPPQGSHQSIQIFRAAPKFIPYRFITLLIQLLIFAVFELSAVIFSITRFGFIGKVIAAGIIAFFLGKLLFLYFFVRLDYEMRFYIITDRSLRIREGVWVVRETTLTFDNIQNMSIDQGPLQRLFGIGNLVVDTAGGGMPTFHSKKKEPESDSMHRGTFKGITYPEELRDLILGYLRRVKSSGLGDHDDAGHGEDQKHVATSGIGDEVKAALRGIREETRAWRGDLERKSISSS